MKYTAWKSLFNEEETQKETEINFNAFSKVNSKDENPQKSDVKVCRMNDKGAKHYYIMYLANKAVTRLGLEEGKAIEFGLRANKKEALYIRCVDNVDTKRKGLLSLRKHRNNVFSVRLTGQDMVNFMDSFVTNEVSEFPLFYDKEIKGNNYMICTGLFWDENRIRWSAQTEDEDYE